MQLNFSRVRLKKILGRTCATSRMRKEQKSIRDSESLPVVQQLTHIRPISLSKPIRDSEGQTTPPPPDWPWSRYSCTCVCASEMREREVSNRDVRSVANLATLQTPLAFFSPKKRLVTNIATSWTKCSESLIVCTSAAARDQRAHTFLCICSVQ